MFHMIAPEQTFVNGSSRKFFLLLLPFQIESILSVICLSFLRWIFQRWKIQLRKKRTAVFSHPPIRPMPHPHLQTNPDYPRRDLPGCRIRRADRSSRGSCRRFDFSSDRVSDGVSDHVCRALFHAWCRVDVGAEREFVAQTVQAVVRAAGLVLRWGAWFVLRLMINCPFQRHIVPVFQISLLRGQNLLVFCGCHKYRIEIVANADLPYKRIPLPCSAFVK